MAGTWAESDPEAAGNWLKTLPAGASREAAVSSYVERLAYASPELAAPWAETIADETARNNSLENIAQNWLRTDRTAAESWIARSSLPQERKTQLLAPR